MLVLAVLASAPSRWYGSPVTRHPGQGRIGLPAVPAFLRLLRAAVADIRALTMDSEFVGGGWLTWLGLMEVPYVVRVKANTLVGGLVGERKRWRKHAAQLHEVFGERVHFAAKPIRNGRDAFVAVISHGFHPELYQMRWRIETFSSHLKKRGYQFEDTRMTQSCRIEKHPGGWQWRSP